MVMAMASEAKQRIWWGQWQLERPERWYVWQIGPLTLWIRRSAREWQIGSRSGSDPLADDRAFGQEVDTAPDVELQRFATASERDTITFVPILPDRPVVTRPGQPFVVGGNERVTLFVTTPVWVQLRWPGTTVALCEVQSFRPSDTWFGANTITGDVCYASRTRARLTPPEEPPVARAISALAIHNKGSGPLLLERFGLPVPLLSLFIDERKRMWTEALIVERDTDGATSPPKRTQGPPRIADETERIAGPREHADTSLLSRTFSVLVG
jgi:hypothetical protein